MIAAAFISLGFSMIALAVSIGVAFVVSQPCDCCCGDDEDEAELEATPAEPPRPEAPAPSPPRFVELRRMSRDELIAGAKACGCEGCTQALAELTGSKGTN